MNTDKPVCAAPSKRENDYQAIDEIVARAQAALKGSDGYPRNCIQMLKELVTEDRDFAGQVEIVGKYVTFVKQEPA